MKEAEMKKEAEFLDVDGAAQLLQVGPAMVRELFRQWKTTCGKVGIPHVMVGSKLARTTREDVRRWYEETKKRSARAV